MLTEVIKNFLKPRTQAELSSVVQPDKVLNDLGSDSYINTGFFDTGSNQNQLFMTNDDTDKLMKQKEKILKYRQVAMIPDVNDGIDEIVNEIIFNFSNDLPIKVKVNQENEKIKQKIEESFTKICLKLNLRKNLYNIVKQSYIDGQLIAHVSFDKKKENGINSIKTIDPCMFSYDFKSNTYKYSENRSSYYSQEDSNFTYSPEEIIIEDFGLYADGLNLSYLEYSIKPANVLRTLEDLLVPMRFSRSISRRVFNVDVGDLPTKRAEEVMQDYQNKFRYKNFYNTETGEVSKMQHITSMVEDYWFSNRSGGRGTTVDTIDETGNLGELKDIMYFYKKLYKSMKIPLSRISMDDEADHGFDYESSQTSKEDIKFFMHISRLRLVYESLLKELLKRELIYTGAFSEADYEEIKDDIEIFFVHNNLFIEKMELDNWTKRIELFANLQEQAGKLLPVEDILKQVFKLSDKEIEDTFKKIQKEEKNPLYAKFYEKPEDMQ